MRVAIAGDSNSGMTRETARERGMYILPMSFLVNGRLCYEGVDLTHEDFYRAIADPDASVSTSQPGPGELTDFWDELLKTNDEVVYIPMSSGLSASCQTALMLAEDYDGRVQVVNNQRISVTQYQSMLDAQKLAEDGLSAQQIRERLEEEKFQSSIYIMVDTLKYLKQGGRITPAAALIGTVLHMKPVLQIQGEKLDAFAKCRGAKQARRTMLDAIRADIDGRFASYKKEGTLQISYSWSWADDLSVVEGWKQEISEAFPGCDIYGDPLALSIGCHIGPGALAVTVQHVLKRRTF